MEIIEPINLRGGALFVLTAFFTIPSFVASRFGYGWHLARKTTRAVQVLMLSVVCIGTLATDFWCLNLICPSKV